MLTIRPPTLSSPSNEEMCLQILVRKPGVKRKLKWSSERKGLDGFICLRIEFGAGFLKTVMKFRVP